MYEKCFSHLLSLPKVGQVPSCGGGRAGYLMHIEYVQEVYKVCILKTLKTNT